MWFPQSLVLRCLLMALVAGVAATISNALASPSRRLPWSGSAAAYAILPVVEKGPPHAPLQQAALTGAQQAETVPPRPSRPPARSLAPTLLPGPPTCLEAVASAPIREISSQEAWQAFQAGTAILDARRSADYTEGHIAGAWCTPAWEADLDDRLILFKARRHPGPEEPIVIYCAGGDCRDSHLLAARLLKDGYFNLLIYREGYPAWVAANRPIEKGQP